MNNTSLFTADRDTHVKIVAVALVAAIVVGVVGINARFSGAGSLAVRGRGDIVVVKAAQPTRFSEDLEAAAIR